MVLHAKKIEARDGEAPYARDLNSFDNNLDELLALFKQAKAYTEDVRIVNCYVGRLSMEIE
jgi:hypothetical protein